MPQGRFASVALAVCFGSNLVGLQTPAPPPAWNVTLAANRTANSTLSVVNKCGNRHSFDVRAENAPFLTIPQPQVQVNGRQTVNLPVRFNTQDLSPGTFRGQVLVVCTTCRAEPTCKQDREVLGVVLNVTPAADSSTPANPTNPTTPTNPPTPVNPTNPTNPTNPPGKFATPRTAAAAAEFAKGPCPEGATDCDELKKKAAALEAGAAASQAQADAAKAAADAAEKTARDAEAAAAAAEKAAQPAPSGYGAKVDGQEYSAADIAYLEKLRSDNNAALKAGKITTTQHQQRAKALTAKLAREERLANEARLKAEAATARAAADAARAAANDARAKADAAQKAADADAAAAGAALEEYTKCLKAIAEKCRLETEARAAADKKKADDAARAAATRAQDERNARAAADADRSRVAEQTYLLDNVKQLGLISSAPFRDIPGAFDRLIDKIIPDILGKTAEQWVAEMATTAAEEAAGVPVPLGVIQAIGGLYQIAAALLDPCTQAGMRRTVERLQGMTNPKTKAKYTLNEALDKTERMCKLLTELKAKVEAIKKLRSPDSRELRRRM